MTDVITTEASLIGSALLDSRCMDEVCEIIPSEDCFGLARHAAIWRSMVQLRRGGHEIDLATLFDSLVGQGLFQPHQQGDLVAMAESTPGPLVARRHAETVRNAWLVRSARIALQSSLDELRSASGDEHGGDLDLTDTEQVRTRLGEAGQRLSDIVVSAAPRRSISLEEAIDQAINDLADEDYTPPHVPSGYPDLDALIYGFAPGGFSVIAGRPGMGKTAIAMNIAARASEHAPVLVLSLEMMHRELIDRLVSMQSGVRHDFIKRRALSKDDWDKLLPARDVLASRPLHIDDEAGLTASLAMAKIRRAVREKGVKLVVIDYLQLMRGTANRNMNRTNEVDEISRSLKQIAKEANVHVMAVAQLNRAVEQREDKRPRSSDLRESGQIEQDADLIMFIHRQAYYHQGDQEWEQQYPDQRDAAELIVAKHRSGATGVVHFHWNAPIGRFTSAAKNHHQHGAAA